MTQDETEHGRPDDRPMPGDGSRNTDTDGARDDNDVPPGPDAEPVYNDRDKLDFNPDDGLYTGTAVTGDTAIPGEHERVDDVPVEEDGDDVESFDHSDDASA